MAAQKKPNCLSVPEIAGTEQLLEIDQIASLLRITRQYLRKLVINGGYPPPDLMIGRLPRWRKTTHNKWSRLEKNLNGD